MPSEAEIIARVDANYQSVSALMATGHDGGELRERDGLLLINTGLPVAMFNSAIVTRQLPHPREQIAEAAAYYDSCGQPFVVRIREGLDDASERACEDLGMPYSDTVPGMALARLEPPSNWERGLEIRAASTDADFAQFFDIVCSVFGFPIAMARQIFTDRLLRVPDTGYYIGYAGDVPVATATLIATDRTAGVYNVATLPDHRGRGYGEALTWHAVREGQAIGCVIASLQASEMGRPVYERMGFRMVSPYRTFHRPD